MNVFEAIDRKMMEIASDSMREVLNERALNFLQGHPELFKALIVLRQVGTLEITEREAKQLVVLGIMQVDDQGYFLSEIVEDMIDIVIAKVEKLTQDKSRGQN